MKRIENESELVVGEWYWVASRFWGKKRGIAECRLCGRGSNTHLRLGPLLPFRDTEEVYGPIPTPEIEE